VRLRLPVGRWEHDAGPARGQRGEPAHDEPEARARCFEKTELSEDNVPTPCDAGALVRWSVIHHKPPRTARTKKVSGLLSSTDPAPSTKLTRYAWGGF
jgi:hypothetical protein